MPGEGRATLSLSRRQVENWFKANGGKEKSAIEKPLLTDEYKQLRNAWARKYFALFTNSSAPVAFLDEKWFYTTNRRRKLKLLPKGQQEQEAPDAVRRPRIRSRRYPVKVSCKLTTYELFLFSFLVLIHFVSTLLLFNWRSCSLALLRVHKKSMILMGGSS